MQIMINLKTRYVVVLAVIVFILSSTIMQIFRINDALPNFGIILSIVLAALSTKRNATVFAFIYGALQDVFLGRLLGANFLIYGVLVYMTLLIIEVMFKGNFMTPLFLVGIGTLIYHVLFYFIMFFFQSTIPFGLLWEKIITEMAMNTLLGYFIYALIFKRIHGYKLGDYNA